MNILNYKGYQGRVEFSAEDDCLFGKVLGIKSLLTFEGANAEEIRSDFEGCIDEYLAMCEERGITPETPFRGSFNVRVSPEIHRELVLRAMNEGISMNALVSGIFASALRKKNSAI